ncbi:MFS transporter [Penicillium expansum]|nr:MFS transporter [Penicillium expansum]
MLPDSDNVKPEQPIVPADIKGFVPTIVCPQRIDIENGSVDNVARDPFGKPLFPEPTTDALDPLNWPTWRKYVIIFMVCFGYFMMTYSTTAPVVAFVQLQSQFNASYAEINWTFAAGNLGATVGPLFFSAMGDIIGRRPVMIIGTTLALIGSGWSSAHGLTIESYAFARFLQVFGTTPAVTVGLAIINDLSWQHERGFRVGLWVLAIDLGCYLGPLFGSLVTTYNQYWVEYHISILLAILLIAQIAFLPETLYPRAAIISFGRNADTAGIKIKRTTQLPFLIFGSKIRAWNPVTINTSALET